MLEQRLYSVESTTLAKWLKEYAYATTDSSSKYVKEPYDIWRHIKKDIENSSEKDIFIIKTYDSGYVIIRNNKDEIIYSGTSHDCMIGEFLYDKLNEAKYITPVLKYNHAIDLNTVTVNSSNLVTNTTATINAIDNLQEEVERIKNSFKEFNKTCMKDNKEEKMDNEFMNFDFGPCAKDLFAMSPYGIAAHNFNLHTWVAYNPDTNEVIDVKIFHINMEGLFYKIPTPIANIKKGDIIIHQDKPMFVQEVNGNNTITAVNYLDASVTTILPLRSPFGFNFITKVISLINLDKNGANKDNPFGSMLPFLMMKDSSIDPMMFFLMSQNSGPNPLGDNPLLMYMLLGKDMDKENLLPLVLMMTGGVLPNS